MSGLALAAVRAQLSLSSSDANRHEGTITSYAEIVKYLLRRYAAEAVIAKANEKIQNFMQRSLLSWDFFQKLWDLTLRCDCVCNEHELNGLFVQGIDISIRSTQCGW